MLVVIYPEIEKIMVEEHIKSTWLSWKTGITYNNLARKLSGEREFKLSEAIAVKRALQSDKPLEELFRRA